MPESLGGVERQTRMQPLTEMRWLSEALTSRAPVVISVIGSEANVDTPDQLPTVVRQGIDSGANSHEVLAYRRGRTALQAVSSPDEPKPGAAGVSFRPRS